MKTLQINEWEVWVLEKEETIKMGFGNSRRSYFYTYLGLNSEKEIFSGICKNYSLSSNDIERYLEDNSCDLNMKHETWEIERQWIIDQMQMNENEEKNSSSCSCDIIYLMNFGCPSVRNLPCRNQK